MYDKRSRVARLAIFCNSGTVLSICIALGLEIGPSEHKFFIQEDLVKPSKHEFLQRFNFQPEYAGCVAVEREFLLRDQGTAFAVPKAKAVHDILEQGPMDRYFCYELSACQYEAKTGPILVRDVASKLHDLSGELDSVLDQLGLFADHLPVAEADMPLDVYPDPDGRYQEIASSMSREKLRAACRVMAVHGHFGMSDMETAIRVYNYLVEHIDDLIEMGNLSNGERMRLYRVVQPNSTPTPIRDEDHLFEMAVKQKFYKNLRDWWYLIRITRFGTVEVRVFDTTDNNHMIQDWMSYTHNLCMEVM